MAPAIEEKELLYEMQARLAYAGALRRSESEGMAFGELKWWMDWLVNQQKEEQEAAKRAAQGKKGGTQSPYQSAASRFGFVGGRKTT